MRLSVLIAIAAVACSAGPVAPAPDAMRAEGIDAAPQQVCGDNRCAGETQATCCLDCGCPPGMMCGGPSGCVSATPVCGDGTCAAAETQAGCCIDCGCAQGSTCTAGGCVAQTSCGDGMCSGGESASTCCDDCACPQGLSCVSHACVDPATCGDGTCTATEAGRCCKDCGCALGNLCGSDGLCRAVGTANLIWTVRNRCENGEDIQLRFFDRDNRLLWPTPTTVYVLAPGEDETHNLHCTKGARICYGANQPQHRLYWGVDIDNSETCASCCFFCDSREVAAGDLVCD